MATFEREFDSFEDAVREADTKPHCDKWDRNHVTRFMEDDKFYGASHDSAIGLALNGWTEGREALKSAMIESAAIYDKEKVSAYTFDVAGGRLSPARAASGDLYCFKRPSKKAGTRRQARTISIGLPLSYLASVEAVEVLRYGAAVLNVVDAIENSGISVHIIGVYQSERVDTSRQIITLKRAGEPLDIDRLAFALCHRASGRRIGFALRSHDPVCDDFQQTMGRTISAKPKSLERDLIWFEGVSRRPPCDHENAKEIILEELRRNGEQGESIADALTVSA